MKYNPGEIYYSTFPKFQEVPDTKDFNIDSKKVNSTPRPAAVLWQVDSDHVIVAPLGSDGVQNHLLFGTFVPLRHQDYPELMKSGHDSYVKTNQVQLIDTKHLYPSIAPKKVTDLKPVDLARVQIYTLYATQTDKEYAHWIGEIVAKNIRVKAPAIEDAVLKELALPKRPMRTPKIAYERGDVTLGMFPPEINNPASTRLTGQHKAILLTDAQFGHIPPGQTYAVPLLPNQKENLPYFSANDVLLGTDRACVSQIQPLNRDWVGEKVAKLNTSQMIEVDRGLISSLGLQQQVINKAKSLIQTQRPKGRG